jgi:diguanylate cyclase (GGDEF)-like protein/PAS domain S-box-containing protein
MDRTRPPSEQARYSDLFGKMTDPVLLLDATDFRILDANLAAEQALQSTRKDLLGKPVSDYVLPAEHPAFQQATRIARRRYYPVKHACQWNVAGRTRHMELQICTLKLTDDDNVIQLIAKDVTRVREAEEKAAQYLRDLEAANQRLEILSTTDGMTGLTNFREFKRLLEAQHEIYVRYKTPYSVIFCDIDHFKHYNDHNGHPAGDQLLRDIAGIFRQLVRKTDVPARYGGEEFVILCPQTKPEDACLLAERVRATVAGHAFLHAADQPGGCLSISIGVASGDDGKTVEEVLMRADEALYRSKKNGRNRVTRYVKLAEPKTAKKPKKAAA